MEFVKGTSLQTIESQSQQDQLCSGIPNLAEMDEKEERP